jgi:5-methylcytosine-specific restriction protein A
MSIIKHAVNLVKSAVKDVGLSTRRSNKWPAVQAKHLLDNPCCAACGSLRKLNVHHMKPFHLHPELELDPDNLITLCMDNDCHILIGHGDNFKAYNPLVKEDSASVLSDLKTLSLVAARAKQQRLFE